MYLKSIEVQGFKSFANRIVFEFHNGITGIVGPNGSGKSNVADAVRWVLGEQKVKQLRSSSMQDVIFAGTENRKPQSYAYVAITLDNSDHQLPLDFNEVTVGRRVYRSGESEYLLNGTACRLKDINELFYDTGIGKEGYSIIGQGQIDKIISGKPEEKRELFDEAAGIVKYKRRKNASVKKLENEQQNLVRVNDILSELEKQLGPLERQSEAARTYLKKRDELRGFDINMFLIEMKRIQEQLKSVEEKYHIADDEHKKASGEYEGIRQQYEQVEAELEKIDEQIDADRSLLSETNLTAEKLEGQIEVISEQIRSVKNNSESLQNRLMSVMQDSVERQEKLEEYRREHRALEESLDKITERQTIAGERLLAVRENIEKLQSGLTAAQNATIDLVSRKGNIQAEQQRFDTMQEQVNIHRAELTRRKLAQKSDTDRLTVMLQESQSILEQVEEKVRAFRSREAQLELKRGEWKTKYDEAAAKLEQIKVQYHRLHSRAESLKGIAERYDGYGNSIRRVMEKKDDIPGIQGVVADLISVEKKYEIAIETALGGSIQNIVTDDEHTAKKLIEYLKKNRLGRATFLPLTSVNGKSKISDERALKEPGVIGIADRLVTCEDRYKGVAGHLLGRVLVVDHIDHAIAIGRKYHHSIRMVTLEGESLQPGGSMTGGAFKNNSNLLGRRREIEEIEEQLKTLSSEQKKLEGRLEDISTARELLREDISQLQQEKQEALLERSRAQADVDHAKEEMKAQEDTILSLKYEEQQIEEQLEEIRQGRESLDAQAAGFGAEEKETQERIAYFQEKLEQEQSVEETRNQEISEIALEAAGIRQRLSFNEENADRILGELQKLEEEAGGLHKESADSEKEVEQRKETIVSIRETVDTARQTARELEEKVKAGLEKRETMSAQYKGFFKQREELSGHINELDKEIFRLNAQKEKLEASEESQTAYMWEEYELTLHHAMEIAPPTELSTPELKKQIARVKEEIKGLGHVNIDAIEEYKNVSERYEFMNAQRNDLQEAEATLLQIIQDLDAGMRKQFQEKFGQIQEEFNKAFRDLFGGGKGTLELAEGEDILECGINIIAHPPGKKLQNMMQLSGGEKALTAIALLFAIQNLKPSPFCLLDEIEAALDDSNVDRFARYLNKLTKHTQFIMITHRRGTMAAADRLYGITMQEKGVSALVSVNLIEADLDE